uniref:Endonuclease/exonuclease/phosphatase family protein n=1 Tax=Prevotella sp. GTC17253 TaxID=3236793 RepID=A0AB33IRN4_9BACT
MIKTIKEFTFRMVAGANIATIIVMLLVGFSDRLNPVDHPVLASAGLVFPVLLVINLGFTFFWVVFRLRMVLIPLAGFLLCYAPIRTYCPFNVRETAPEDAIKVLSYNVLSFCGWETQPGEDNAILEYIVEQNADIVCLQEAMPSGISQQRVEEKLKPLYQYCDTAVKGRGGDCIALYSKYPIISRQRIHYASPGNLSMAYEVKINDDTVVVVNNHLETTGLSMEDKANFKQMVKGNVEAREAKTESKRLIDKLGEAAKKRGPQAEAVARFISEHKGRSIIVCGDFNDNPISYTRRTIARNLTDCYVESGLGPGISYHHSGFFVRIDNIMCSDDWTPYGCRVDNSIKNSDHYPIYCWLKKK